MKALNFSFRKFLSMIFFIFFTFGLVNAQEKPVIKQPEKAGSVTQQPTVQGSKQTASEPVASPGAAKTAKPKQVKASRPALSQTKGARPPTIIRPSGSGIPKGTGNPGGAVGPGRR